MITKFGNFLITESPDTVWYKDKRGSSRKVEYQDADAKPFVVKINDDHTEVLEIFVGPYGKTHSSIKNLRDDGKAYAGRIWKKHKLMSFWVYPNEILFVSIVKALEKKLKTKIFNNDWKIEIIKSRDNQEIVRQDPNKFGVDFLFGGDRYGDRELISVEDYAGSQNQPEELLIQHMLNWEQKDKLKKEKGVKGFGSAKTAWDKPHNIKYRRTIYQEKNILNFDNYMIKETPDFLYIDGEEHYYHYPSARPFFVDMEPDHETVKKLYLGDLKGMHSDMRYKKDEVNRAYAGRLWQDLKVLSFWVYPSPKIFNQIILLLEDQLDIKMFNNGWQVEVVKKDDEILRYKFGEDNSVEKDYEEDYDEDYTRSNYTRSTDPEEGNDSEDYFFGDRSGPNHKDGEEFIPIEDYAGSEDQPEELLAQHLLSWEEKQKLKK
jgi:hypothetical protein